MWAEGKVPKNGEQVAGFSFPDNAPAHRPVFVKDSLATLQRPLYSSDRLQLVFTYFRSLNQH